MAMQLSDMRLSDLPRAPRRVVVAAMGALIFLLPTGAQAQKSDADWYDTKMFQWMVGKITGNDGPDIDYRERSPLVLPPSRDLPPPETAASAALSKNPEWPKDPDVQAALAEKAGKTAKNASVIDDPYIRAGRPATRAELDKGRLANAGTPSGTDSPRRQMRDNGQPLSQSELGYKGGIFNSLFGKQKEETARFTSEPPRSSLIEPPTGYLTPSANQPYGITARKDTTKMPTLEDKGIAR